MAHNCSPYSVLPVAHSTLNLGSVRKQVDETATRV